MDVRVLHEGSWVYPGGSERLAREMARSLDAKVTVGHSGEPDFWDGLDVEFPFQNVVDGKLKRLPKQLREFYTGLMFRTLEFDEDIVVSSGTTAKWWAPKANQRHIHYCHSPPPQLFVDPARNVLDSCIKTGAGMIDKFYTDMCDQIISNSEFTASRVETYYNRDSTVINPPIDTERFEYQDPSNDPYFVMIGRLNRTKRSYTVARAFRDLDVDLIMVGDGPLRSKCESVANVTVLGYTSDAELHNIISRSTGGIAFADKEHCGMTPKEFQSAGKPVIVPDEPNLKNHVTDGVDGVIVSPTREGVRVGVERVSNGNWDPEGIAGSVEEWTVPHFRNEIREIVQ